MLHESQLTILVQVLVDPVAYDDFIDSNFIELYVILSLLSPIALGIPWLELRNPHILYIGPLLPFVVWVNTAMSYHPRSTLRNRLRCHTFSTSTIRLCHRLPPRSSSPYKKTVQSLKTWKRSHGKVHYWLLSHWSSSLEGDGDFSWRRRTKPCTHASISWVWRIIINNTYPLPRIGSGFGLLHEATVFSKQYLRNAYHLVWLERGMSGKWLLILTWVIFVFDKAFWFDKCTSHFFYSEPRCL